MDRAAHLDIARNVELLGDRRARRLSAAAELAAPAPRTPPIGHRIVVHEDHQLADLEPAPLGRERLPPLRPDNFLGRRGSGHRENQAGNDQMLQSHIDTSLFDQN
jgi:hypothetical protein